MSRVQFLYSHLRALHPYRYAYETIESARTSVTRDVKEKFEASLCQGKFVSFWAVILLAKTVLHVTRSIFEVMLPCFASIQVRVSKKRKCNNIWYAVSEKQLWSFYGKVNCYVILWLRSITYLGGKSSFGGVWSADFACIRVTWSVNTMHTTIGCGTSIKNLPNHFLRIKNSTRNIAFSARTGIWVANRHLGEFGLRILHAFEWYGLQTQHIPQPGVGHPEKFSQTIFTPSKIVS